MIFQGALELSIRVDLSFRWRKLISLLAWISSTLLNILPSIDQVFLINFQFQVSKANFWYSNKALKTFRITRAQILDRVLWSTLSKQEKKIFWQGEIARLERSRFFWWTWWQILSFPSHNRIQSFQTRVRDRKNSLWTQLLLNVYP